jgi:outer membrane protein assembly factor BamB
MRLAWLFAAIVPALALPPAVRAQQWSQWRGPNRDGVAPGFRAPKEWPEKLAQKWKVAVGEGYSSPVVAGGAAYLHSRDAESEIVQRLDLATGSTVWKKTYPAPFSKNKYASRMSMGPFSTPAVSSDGARLFTLGSTAVLSCWNTQTGELFWRKDFSSGQDTSKLFTGTAMSPLLEGGAVIVHVGDDRGGRIIAYDQSSGNPRWMWTGDGPGYASPIAVTLNGARQLVTLTDRSAVGISVTDGKLLWSVPFKDEWNENIVTPVLFKDLLILSGVRKGTFALRIGPGHKPETAWANSDVNFYMSSPVLAEGKLCGLSSRNKGQFICLDPSSGKVLWTGEPRRGDGASFTLAGGSLLILTSEGQLFAAAVSASGIQTLRTYAVAESSTWSHLTPAGNRLLVKDAASLTAWDVP